MHLFLTGEKRVGKSTVVKRLLAELPLALGGFYTVRTETLDPSQPSVHMLHAGGDDVPSADNLLFYCLEAGGAKTAQRFDELGCRMLEESKGAELLIMDELGPGEKNAVKFQNAVLRALDAQIPILGVLQKDSFPLFKIIAEHPKATIIELTEQNRNNWRTELLPILKDMLP